MKIWGYIILAIAGVLDIFDFVSVKTFFGLYGFGAVILLFGYLESYDDKLETIITQLDDLIK